MKIVLINKLDQFISGQINKIVGANIPRAVKHASWKDGGLSIPSIREKAHVGRVKALIRLITNNDYNIRLLINSAINNERIKRKIPIEEDINNHSFFNWNTSINVKEHKGTNSIVQRARISLNELNLSLFKSDTLSNDEDINNSKDLSVDSFKIHDKTTDDSLTFQSCKNIALFLTKQRRERWKLALDSHSMHLHSFHSLINNPLSSEFIIKQKFPINDKIIKFALKARTNNLGTPEFDELINGKQHVFCPFCTKHGKNCIQSLSHILNGCVHKFPDYTVRHNRIQGIIVEYVKELPGIEEIYTDNSIHMPDIPSELSRLRPDIITWFNNRTKCIIFEISIPYASIQWNEDTLEKVYKHKKEKYNSLVSFLRRKGIEVVCGVVIVSSVGAVYHESINDINRIFSDRKKCKTIIKRLAINSIMGSLNVWTKSSITKDKPNQIELNNIDSNSNGLVLDNTKSICSPDAHSENSNDVLINDDSCIINGRTLNVSEYFFKSSDDDDMLIEDDHLSDDDASGGCSEAKSPILVSSDTSDSLVEKLNEDTNTGSISHLSSEDEISSNYDYISE